MLELLAFPLYGSNVIYQCPYICLICTSVTTYAFPNGVCIHEPMTIIHPLNIRTSYIYFKGVLVALVFMSIFALFYAWKLQP